MNLRKTKIIALLLWVVLLVPITASPTDNDNILGKKIAEMEKKLPTSAGKEKIDILLQLASATYTAAPKKCIEYCRQVLDLSRQIGYPGGRARALILQSYALSVLGDWEKPFVYSQEALAIYENQKDQDGIGKALSAIGYFYLRIDYFNIALDYFLRSMRVYEELPDQNNLFLPYVNLGSLYANLEDYPKAIEYYRKAWEIVKTFKNDKRIPYCLHNIGVCYLEMGDNTKAMEYISTSLRLFENSGDEFWIAAALVHIGRIHFNLNHPDQSLTYFSQAQQLREKLGDQVGLFTTLCYIGDTYLEMKDSARASIYYDRAFPIAEKLDDKNSLERIYKNYANLYAARQDYKKAFENYQKYAETRDLLFNQNKNKQIAELQVQFETEKKAREIEILKKDNKIQAFTRNTFIAGFFLVSIILILLFKKYLYLLAFWKKQKYIGQYRLIKTIGSGGMGTVYLAHYIQDKNKLAAVKVLKEELVEDENSRQRFKHEGTIIDRLNHPNIIKILERGEYKGKLYIVMEYLEGKTLLQKISGEGKLDLSECFAIMMQVTDALAFIHSKNIVHRDLKPANIMLIQKDNLPGLVKLLDFGVALMKFQTRLTQTGILVGTIHYIAPEQITGNQYSAASDIYSLGITFYEMLVGEPAFTAETITEVVERVINEAPKEPRQLRPEIPDSLNHLIMKMLSKEPSHRPLAGDVLSALKKMAKEQSSWGMAHGHRA
jgi:tetratricopeptide (TPR) repeat protein